MSNFNVGKILEELQDMHKKLGEHIISDMDCLSYDDDNAEFDDYAFEYFAKNRNKN